MIIYYFNATHWDREWYYSQEAFRTFLVEMTDKMLNLLDEPDNLPQFVFDGQTIVLEDVLEIHPEWRPRLEKVIKNGQLKVGPWYVMPDEFLVSGEALLRNLLLGKRIAESFGHAPWNVGYICDIFGHAAQTPQIFKGFGMQGSALWRGVPSETGPFLLWSASDGSTLRTLHYHSAYGYSEFSLRVRGIKPVKVDKDFKKRLLAWLPEAQKHWGENIVCTDAQDHAYPALEMKKIRKILKECCPDAEIIHTDYTEVFENEFKDEKKLGRISGELIYPSESYGEGYQISGTLSSRYDIKHANDICQNALQYNLEPLTAISLALGKKTDPAFLRYAWKHLVQNHAHDSICGCSPDIVHRHMHTRFEEVKAVVDKQLEELKYQDLETVSAGSRWDILHAVALDEADKLDKHYDKNGNYLLRIANPLPYEVEQVSEIELRFPANDPKAKEFLEPFTMEPYRLFRIFNEDNQEVTYSIQDIRRGQMDAVMPGFALMYDIYKVVLPVKLRAAGWTSYALKTVAKPRRHFATLRTGLNSASNGLLALDIADNGTFTVTDLRTKRSYPGQNNYRIDREIGDGWAHCAPPGAAVTTGGFCRSVRVTCDDPNRIEFEIIREFDVPHELIYAGGINNKYEGVRESTETVSFIIKTRVALDKGSDALRIHTEINNTLLDARLQLLIPTGIADKYFANQAFAFNERMPGRTLGTKSETFAEVEPLEKNFAGIIGKRDAKGGIVLLSKAGLHEAGTLAGVDDCLTVTLFRSIRRTVFRNGEREGELLQHLNFDYLLKCTAPKTTYVDLAHAQQILQAEAFPVSVIAADLVKASNNESFVTLSGKLSFSALKPAESEKPNEIIVRLVNLSGKSESGKLSFAKKYKKVELCRLDETVERLLVNEGKNVIVPAEAWQIVTVKITF